VNNHFQVVNQFGKVNILSILHVQNNRFDQRQNAMDSKANRLHFRNLSDSQTLKGGVDERGNLLGRFQPGPKKCKMHVSM
jgi:hypothetical protein